jgi:hypothetical protein
MPTFNISHGLPGTDRATWALVLDADGSNPLEYESGENAAIAVSQLKLPNFRALFNIPAEHGIAIVKQAETGGDEHWREREKARFISGQYKPVPWASELDWNEPIDHYLHIAESNRTKIAFTENEVKGRLDRQKVMYVREYLRAFSEFSEERIEHWASVISGLSVELFFANTSDEIEAAYIECGETSGLDSCMVYKADRFASFCHPTRVYGAGDLALAYIRDENGHISARALVWPEKKRCGRLYGNNTYGLKGALKAVGYERFSNCALAGARLLKLPDTRHGANCYVMPYIDGHQSFGDSICGEFFVIEGEYGAGSTSGIAYIVEQCECEHCGDIVNEDDIRDVNGESWCNSCVENNSYCCEHCDERYSLNDDYNSVTVRRRRWGNEAETWCPSCTDSDAVYSENEGEYFLSDIAEHCDHCSDTFPEWNMVDAVNGDRACENCAETIAEESEDEAEETAPLPEYVPGAGVQLIA